MASFAFENIYPFSMGESIAAAAAVDGPNQSALGLDANTQIIGVDKAKSHNITMAMVVIVLAIVFLQMSSR